MTENKSNRKIYDRPLSDVIDIRPEGVLCGSDLSGGSEGSMNGSNSDL